MRKLLLTAALSCLAINPAKADDMLTGIAVIQLARGYCPHLHITDEFIIDAAIEWGVRNDIYDLKILGRIIGTKAGQMQAETERRGLQNEICRIVKARLN